MQYDTETRVDDAAESDGTALKQRRLPNWKTGKQPTPGRRETMPTLRRRNEGRKKGEGKEKRERMGERGQR